MERRKGEAVILLTTAQKYPISPFNGGDCMKGSVQYHAPAKRYYISWYPERIWKNPITGEPFWHEKNAHKILDKMRCEVDAGTFNLRTYMPDSPVMLKVVASEWLKAFTGTEATRKGAYNRTVHRCQELNPLPLLARFRHYPENNFDRSAAVGVSFLVDFHQAKGILPLVGAGLDGQGSIIWNLNVATVGKDNEDPEQCDYDC